MPHSQSPRSFTSMSIVCLSAVVSLRVALQIRIDMLYSRITVMFTLCYSISHINGRIYGNVGRKDASHECIFELLNNIIYMDLNQMVPGV